MTERRTTKGKQLSMSCRTVKNETETTNFLLYKWRPSPSLMVYVYPDV